MKNTCKRALALALAVVMLLSVSVIGVSAEVTEVALNGGVMTDTVAVYEFWQEKYASDSNFLVNFGATDMTNTLKGHYDNEELNWRIAWNTVATDSCTGKSLFSGGRPYHYVQIGKSSGNNFYGLYLKSPGAGTYDVTLNYSVTNDIQAASEMKAYLFPAAFVDDSVAGGAQWKYVISGNDNKAEDGTDTNGIIYLGSYSCYDANVPQYEERSLVKSGVVLDDGEEYILVLAAVSTNGTSSTLKHYTNSLTLEKTSADEVEQTNKTVGFYTNAYGDNAQLGLNATQIKADYEDPAKAWDWRLETASNLYQFRSGGNNKFNTSLKNPKQTIRLLQTASTASVNSFFALRVKSPGTGNFKVSLIHGANTDGVDDLGVYVIPASVVEGAVADAGYTYSTLATDIAANFSLNGNINAEPFAPVNNAINAVLKNPESAYSQAVVPHVSCDAVTHTTASYTGNNLVTEGGIISCTAEEEYIVVFKVEVGGAGAAGNTYLYLTGLKFEQQAVANNAATIGETGYPTVKAALNAAEEGETVKLLADCAIADLKNPLCNIDLNGKTLTVYGDMTTVAAVSDSSEGNTGILKVTGKMNLAGDQAQLPLYDAAAGGYGLYSFAWGEDNQSEAVANNANARKFWFQLFFDNAKAYALIASGTSGLSIGIDMKWGEGEDDCASCVFVDKTDKTAAAFAAGWGAFMQTAENPWLYVTVQNAVEGMTVTPVIEANGAQVACASIAY